jgi:hypothetical protein
VELALGYYEHEPYAARRCHERPPIGAFGQDVGPLPVQDASRDEHRTGDFFRSKHSASRRERLGFDEEITVDSGHRVLRPRPAIRSKGMGRPLVTAPSGFNRTPAMQTWDEIRREWLPGGGDAPLAPEVIVAGYAAVRRFLGPTWPEDAFNGSLEAAPLGAQ